MRSIPSSQMRSEQLSMRLLKRFLLCCSLFQLGVSTFAIDPSFDYCTNVVFTTVMPICVLSAIFTVGFMHRRAKGPEVWKAYIYAMLMFTFFIFLNCSTTLFHFLKCDSFPDLNDRFLMKDT